jgi:exonuclease III
VEENHEFAAVDPALLEEVEEGDRVRISEYGRVIIPSKAELIQKTRGLDKDQRKVVDIALKYARDIKKSRIKRKAGPPPPHLMVHGTAGTGKSTVIHLVAEWIVSTLQQAGDSPDQPYVLKTAFTGTAASGIGGQTLTSTFNLGFGNQHYCLSDKERDKKKIKLKDLVALIIDEISFVSCDNFYKLDLKLQEIMENKEPFGGVAIFCFGDFFQLKPVQGRFLFEIPSNPAFHVKHRFCNLWNLLTVINLTTNHRQGASGEFAELLNRMRVLRKGEMEEEDIKTWKSRVRKKGHADLNGATVNIVCTRVKAANLNEKYLKSLQGEVVTVKAVVYKASQKKFKPPLHASGTIGTTSYMDTLKLKVGAKVMLIANVRTEDSLTNGQMGQLVGVIRDREGGVQQLMVKFSKPDAGNLTRRESPQLEQRFPGATKVERKLESFSLTKGSSSQANLIQFPIVLGHAVTVHKTQGMTIYMPNTANIDMMSMWEAAQGFVGASRTQEIGQLYIFNDFNPNKIFANPKALEEHEKMNARSMNKNPGRWEKEARDTVRVAALNIARLEPHVEDVRIDPTLLKADIIHLCETWVSEEVEGADLFQLVGYQANFVSVGNGRGLVTYSKEGFQHREDRRHEDYQITKFSSVTIDSIHVYRSAEGSEQEVKESLMELLEAERVSIITGDFNICLDEKPRNLITAFLVEQGFQQLVTAPTRVSGRRIDHAYIRDPSSQLANSHLTMYNPYYSDHDALCITLATKVMINSA